MAARREISSAASNVPAMRKKRMEEFDSTSFCTYWPPNPAFDPKRVLLCRLFFINEYRTKYVSLVFTLLATIYHWRNFGISGQAVYIKPTFSAMNRWTPWRRDFPCYGTPCVVAKSLLGVAGARAVHFGWT
jgi:hypothetical protein